MPRPARQQVHEYQATNGCGLSGRQPAQARRGMAPLVTFRCYRLCPSRVLPRAHPTARPAGLRTGAPTMRNIPIPIDISRLTFVVVAAPRPRLVSQQTGEIKTDKNGRTVYTVGLSAADST